MDTARTIDEANRLRAEMDRPNVMIKVPATPEGIPAIEALVADGVNVNITLLFSMKHYEAVARAYIQGLQRCLNPRQVSSVASFFVSRVDTAVDGALKELGTEEASTLLGKVAIANCKLVYRRFHEIFYGEAFAPRVVEGRGSSAPSGRQHGDEEPCLLRCPLRGESHRTGYRQYPAASHTGCIQTPWPSEGFDRGGRIKKGRVGLIPLEGAWY